MVVATPGPKRQAPRLAVWAGAVTALGCLAFLAVGGGFRVLTAAGVAAALAALVRRGRAPPGGPSERS